MQRILTALFVITTIFFSANVNAQNTKIIKSKKIVQDINGNNYYLHTVKKGETLYSISKIYNTPIDSIGAHNNGLDGGIKIDQRIKIPIINGQIMTATPKDTIAPLGFTYHKVLTGETLYRISVKHQISVKKIKENNPKISDNIHPGDWLLIPSKETQKAAIAQEKYDSLVNYKIGWRDNYYRLTKKFNLNQAHLEQINPQLKEKGLIKGLMIKVPYGAKGLDMPEYNEVILDSIIPTQDTILTAVKRVCNGLGNNYQTYKIGLLMPLFTNLDADIRVDNDYMIKDLETYPSFRFIEFYQGALLALDSLKKQGFKVELFVWDTKASTHITDSICKLSDFANLDVVVGPFYSKNVKTVRPVAAKFNIQMIDLFSKDNITNDSIGEFIELRPSRKNEYNAMAKYINDSLSNAQVMILHAGRPTEINKLLQLKQSLTYSGSLIDSTRISIYKYQDGGLKTILNSMSNNKTYVIINLVDDEARISNFIRQVNIKQTRRKSINIDIIIMAEDRVWSKYKTLDINYLNNLKYTYTTDFYINYNDSVTVIPFNNKFYKTYSRMPSKLGYIGYDIFWFFGNALYDYGLSYPSKLNNLKYKTIHNKIELEKVNNVLYRNKSTNILQYKDLKIHNKRYNE